MKNILIKLKRLFYPSAVSRSNLRLVRYKSKLYFDCANLLLKNGFTQKGDYCFVKKYKGNPYGGESIFFLYHFHLDGLTLNTYNPKQDFIIIKSIEDMQKQIDLLNNGSLNQPLNL